jgi:hypothetical protein
VRVFAASTISVKNYTKARTLIFNTQSNGGAACTCVVTEYYYHSRADFVIDVDLFTHEELRQQLRDLVHSYRRNHFHAREMEFENERRDWAKRAQLAEDTFRAMFTDRFTTALLRSAESDDNIVEAYLNWAMDSRHNYNVYRHTVTDSMEECSSLLMRLTSARGDAEGLGVWPYVKKIRFEIVQPRNVYK